MTSPGKEYPIRAVEAVILTIRGQKVILDADLARIYRVPTKVLNQAVRRNRDRFPEDFLFQLAPEEVMDLRSQTVTSNDGGMRSQTVTGSGRGGRRYAPHAFTEHGAIMAATVLNSPEAVQMSVFVVRAFVKMREHLIQRAELERRLAEIEKTLIGHDAALHDVYRKLRPLLLPEPYTPPKEVKGFRVRERRARYGTR